VEELIFERMPHVKDVGVDNSEAMTQLAAECLFSDRFVPILGDLAELRRLILPSPSSTL